MKRILLIALSVFFITACGTRNPSQSASDTVASGQESAADTAFLTLEASAMALSMNMETTSGLFLLAFDDATNCYRDPDPASPVVESFPTGTVCEVVVRSVETYPVSDVSGYLPWYGVTVGERTGWIHGSQAYEIDAAFAQAFRDAPQEAPADVVGLRYTLEGDEYGEQFIRFVDGTSAEARGNTCIGFNTLTVAYSTYKNLIFIEGYRLVVRIESRDSLVIEKGSFLFTCGNVSDGARLVLAAE